MSAFLRNGKISYNDAIGIGQAGGIGHSTYAVTGLFTDALTDRENTPEKDLWAKGFHSKENIDGLGFEGGGLSLDTQYNGTVVGMDLYRKANTTAGVAIAYADGNSSSSDGVAYTRNDATYLGASLYGLKDLGAIVWQRISPMWAAAMTSSSIMQIKSSPQNRILKHGLLA